jgi:hypothetical protein
VRHLKYVTSRLRMMFENERNLEEEEEEEEEEAVRKTS